MATATHFDNQRIAAWRTETIAMLALAWPLILSNLTMSLIQATDVVLMGWLGPRQLAASALGLNLTMVFTVFGMGVLAASAPLIASEIGRRAHSVRDVRRTFRQSIWLTFMIVIPIWAILWNSEAIIGVLGQEPALARDAGLFMRGYMWSMLPFLLFQAMRNFISALERPGWILAISVVGIALNALLSWALIFGRLGLPALGLFGGGLGSSLVWMAMAFGLGIVLVVHPRFRRYRLFGRFWRPDWPRFARIWQLGLPIGITMGFEAAVFSAAAYLMGLINADSLAAHAIALQIAALTFMVPMGLGQAATVRVGIGYGRADTEAITRSGWVAFALGVGFMSVMAAMMWLIPGPLVRLFLDPAIPGNAQVIALAISFLSVAAVFQIADGAQVVGAGMLRGLHDTRVPMLFAGFGYWVIGIGVGTVLAFWVGLDGVGVWIGLASGLAVVSVLLIRRWLARARLGLLPE